MVSAMLAPGQGRRPRGVVAARDGMTRIASMTIILSIYDFTMTNGDGVIMAAIGITAAFKVEWVSFCLFKLDG